MLSFLTEFNSVSSAVILTLARFRSALKYSNSISSGEVDVFFCCFLEREDLGAGRGGGVGGGQEVGGRTLSDAGGRGRT